MTYAKLLETDREIEMFADRPVTNCLDEVFGLVYGAGDFAAKIPLEALLSAYDLGETLSWLHRVLETHAEAYDAGICVPRPVGIFGVTVRNDDNPQFFDGVVYPGYFMERVYGIRGDKIVDSALKEHAGRLKSLRFHLLKPEL